MRTAVIAVVLIATLCSACGSTELANPDSSRTTSLTTVPPASATTTLATSTNPEWTEQDVVFPFAGHDLHGVISWPSGAGPHPAIVLLSGSGDSTGVRSGSAERTFVDHSRKLAAEGFAVLRYDPPGVGRSTGGGVIPSLDERVEETRAALDYLQSLTAVDSGRIGLQGWSQGPWIMAMTVARYPGEVAFLVSIVGSGQSVAHQQVYGIKAQSEAAGLSEGDVAKAVLFGRLLIDWQLPQPMFEETNRTEALRMGTGPWTEMVSLVYDAGDAPVAEDLAATIALLRSIKDEPWTDALYLDLLLTRLESIPSDITVEELAALRSVMAENLMTDPKDFLTEVRVPLLALFGENDLNVDSRTSPGLFDKYLSEAGNEDYTIVVFPAVGHDIGLRTPDYWRTLSGWLSDRFAN